jgi:opacity protein-like surface antigen
MANGYVDLHLGIGVIPYAGFGIGWGVVKYDFRTKEADVFEVDDTDSVFVYNAMVGGRIPLTEVSELSLGYRYIATEDIRVQSRIEGSSQWLDAEFDSHEMTIALRFNF